MLTTDALKPSAMPRRTISLRESCPVKPSATRRPTGLALESKLCTGFLLRKSASRTKSSDESFPGPSSSGAEPEVKFRSSSVTGDTGCAERRSYPATLMPERQVAKVSICRDFSPCMTCAGALAQTVDDVHQLPHPALVNWIPRHAVDLQTRTDDGAIGEAEQLRGVA